MAVKIVTDSSSDIPPDVAGKLDITLVPMTVRFGNEVFRDGVDLTTEQFYERLVHSKTMPTTSVTSPGALAEIFQGLAEQTDEILVITVSRQFSAFNEVSQQAAPSVEGKSRVTIIDSGLGAMAEGLVVIATAKAAQAGAGIDELTEITRRNIPRSEIRMAFDTLEYLKRGGRIGRAQALLGSIIKVNPVVGIKDGEAYPYARERSRAKTLRYLYDFVMGYSRIDEMAIEDATTPEEADKLAEQLSVKFPRERIYRSKVTPVVGSHVGPRAIAVAVLGDR